MRIIFDGDVFVSQRFGGVSRYFSRLAKELARVDTEVMMFCGLHVNEYIQGLPFARGYRVPSIRRTHIVRKAISRLLQSRLIRRLPIDDRLEHSTVLHKTWYDPDFFDSRFPVVVTVHDLIPELFGKRNEASTLRKEIVCGKATQIIAVSETTKRDLLNVYGMPEERVQVVYHGVDLGNCLAGEKVHTQEQPLLLYIGTRGWYKNFHRFVQAVAGSRFLRQNCTILCCGGGPFTKNETESIRALGLADSFRQSSPNDDELNELYRQAQALVIPSLYEGFGLPVLEAMAQGCCVACSNQGSLPEVAGDAAVFFDPTEPDGIAAALERLCLDPTFHASLQQKGFERCKLFSWNRCATATKLVYEQSLNRCSC
jgi:glycosyltransferase involved in cell wall biosynthesis